MTPACMSRLRTTDRGRSISISQATRPLVGSDADGPHLSAVWQATASRRGGRRQFVGRSRTRRQEAVSQPTVTQHAEHTQRNVGRSVRCVRPDRGTLGAQDSPHSSYSLDLSLGAWRAWWKGSTSWTTPAPNRSLRPGSSPNPGTGTTYWD